MTDMITATGLVKRYKEVEALAGLDLTVPEGTVLALLGPNGAGKTTAVRVLTTLLKPDAGSAVVAGVDILADPDGVRSRIGLSGQYAAVDEHLTGFENLEMVGRLYGMGRTQARARAHELLERFALADAGDRPSKTYSGGMRRRLDLAGALVAATRAAGCRCGTSSASWSPRVRRCCSPPSTSRRPTASPTTSWSSTAVVPSPAAPPTS